MGRWPSNSSILADSFAAFLRRLQLQPTLQDTAFILAQAGYVNEASKCTQLCSEIASDSRVLECLSRETFGDSEWPLSDCSAAFRPRC